MICQYCGGERVVSEINRTAWSICPCGIWYREPMPKESEMEKYYQAEYRYGHPIPNVCRRPAWIASNLPQKPGTLLDVGCADGKVLELAENKGWEVEGVEPDIKSREEASQFGTVYASLKEVTKHYDWLVASHVIEHTLDAPAFMKELRNYADNFIFIVPLESAGYPHVYAFTQDGFDLIVQLSGFIKMKSAYSPGIHYWVICKG